MNKRNSIVNDDELSPTWDQLDVTVIHAHHESVTYSKVKEKI